ncbi:MAG: DUF721 domain-containing protein [Balneolales bacterium]
MFHKTSTSKLGYYSKKKPQALSSLLEDFIEDLPHRKELKKGMVLSLLPEYVGPAIAKQCEDIHFEGPRLVMRIKNPGWRHELHMQRYNLARQLNRKVKEEIIKEIIVRG